MDFKKGILFIITFFVAFCSIVYELIYSQLLTIIFGGTVLRYSMTIGLFLFSLGIGSFFYNFLEKYDKRKLFVYLEITLSLVGFFSVAFIILLNSYLSFLPNLLLVSLSNIPIILVGILSGLELPFLSNFVGEKTSSYSQVLGVDYFGSLAGTFLYSMLFYPYQGLIFSAFIVAFFNLLIAVAFFFFLYKKRNKILFILSFLFVFVFVLLFFNMGSVSDGLMKVYLKESVTQYYSNWGFEEVVAKIDDLIFTPYQMIYSYRIMLDPNTTHALHDKCLNIDEHVQICDSWVKEYHAGLVDVPLSFFENVSSDTQVLLIGGGDGIATNTLRKYNISVDHVDIDEKFVDYAMENEFITQYSNNSWNYSLLNLTIGDGFKYMKDTNKRYDLILLDLPGLKEDKLLPLYSREFFLSVNRSLREGGVMVMWVYPFDKYPEYSSILKNTLKVSGFNFYLPYKAYILPEEQGNEVENYILVSRENNRQINLSKNEYVSSFPNKYGSLNWTVLENSGNGQINSIFKPSYKMLIKDG